MVYFRVGYAFPRTRNTKYIFQTRDFMCFKVAYGGNIIDFTVLLFDNPAHTKYYLAERTSDEEYFRHQKGILTGKCKIFGGKELKRNLA